MQSKFFRKVWLVIAIGVVLAIAGCNLSTTGGTPAVSAGIMTKGSVILNGVHYDDSSASVSADEAAKTAGDLANGMRIKLKGTRNDDGLTGTADQVEVENEVRGAISAVTAVSLTVLGQEVFVDAATVFANGNWPADFVLGVDVEVHGQRNAAGDILASRLEKLGGAVQDELRGIVTNWTAVNFQIVGSGLTFTYDVSTVIVGGVSFTDGDLVEVHLTGNYASRVELEDAEDTEFEAVGEQQIQGFVSSFVAHPGSFEIDGQQVTTSASTRFEAGSSADLDNDMVVEAEGQFTAGVLYAEKIKFKDSMRLHDNAPGNGSSDLLGKAVLVNGLTEFGGGLTGLGDIVSGVGIRVRGFLNPDGTTITATRVDELSNPVGVDEQILQGVVTSFTSGASLVIAGITVDVSGSPTISGDDPPADLTAFFGFLRANRTVVKARGTFAAGTLTANEISIE